MKRSRRVRAPRFRIRPNGSGTLAGVSWHTLDWILTIARNDTYKRLQRYEKRLKTGVNDPQMEAWVRQLEELMWVLEQFDKSRLAALDADHARGRKPPSPRTPEQQRAAWKAQLQERNRERQWINRFIDEVFASGQAKYEQEDRDGPSEETP